MTSVFGCRAFGSGLGLDMGLFSLLLICALVLTQTVLRMGTHQSVSVLYLGPTRWEAVVSGWLVSPADTFSLSPSLQFSVSLSPWPQLLGLILVTYLG